MPEEKLKDLQAKAKTIRRHIVEMIACCGSGHPGGSLSAADIITVLYFYKMKYRPNEPEWEGRDRFVLSKGHAAPVLYSALAEAGYFPKNYLKTLRTLGSSLQGHVDMLSLPGVEMSTGSLGQGLSAANGMALALRMDKLDNRVYAVIGDGESQEGQIWEAAMTAGHYKLGNLTAILDHNKYQIDGKVEEIKGIQPIADKWKAFRWNVIDGVNGHDIKGIIAALDKAEAVKDKPSIIIAETVKGKGISFMENRPLDFHGKAPTEEELETALKELK
ncbi:transketolase [Candidatus Margulisiibacteriota bacterium]